MLICTCALAEDTNHYFMTGGFLGVISSVSCHYSIPLPYLMSMWLSLSLHQVLAILGLLRTSSGSTRSLLLYRAVSNCGLGLRFALSPAFMEGVCNAPSCDVNDGNGDDCTYASGMLQFFIIASQAWILCLAYDFWVTVTNPMSSSSISRVPKYHAFCWTIASFFALGMTVSPGVVGYFQVSNLVDDFAICWVKSGDSQEGKSSSNWRTFVFFYIPWYVVLVYVFIIVVRAYGRLKNGIAKTFQSRAKLLSLNGLNIGIYVLYWFINATFIALHTPCRIMIDSCCGPFGGSRGSYSRHLDSPTCLYIYAFRT